MHRSQALEAEHDDALQRRAWWLWVLMVTHQLGDFGLLDFLYLSLPVCKNRSILFASTINCSRVPASWNMTPVRLMFPIMDFSVVNIGLIFSQMAMLLPFTFICLFKIFVAFQSKRQTSKQLLVGNWSDRKGSLALWKKIRELHFLLLRIQKARNDLVANIYAQLEDFPHS